MNSVLKSGFCICTLVPTIVAVCRYRRLSGELKTSYYTHTAGGHLCFAAVNIGKNSAQHTTIQLHRRE